MQADGRFYRLGGKGKRVLRETVDEFVLHQIAREIRGKEFVGKLVEAAHEMADGIEDNPAARAWRMSRCANKPGQSYFRSDSVLGALLFSAAVTRGTFAAS